MSGLPMRVLHVIPAVAPRYGGPSRTVIELGRALAARGLDVTLASTDADGAGRLPVPLGGVTRHAGLPAVFFARRRSEAFKYSPDLARWLRSEVSQFDVVHIHAVFSHASIAAARSCWRADVPYVLRPLGTLTPWALAQKPIRKRVMTRLVGERMVGRAAALHYTTRAEEELTESIIGPTRGVVVPLGVDEAWLGVDVPAAASREPVILAIGRLHPAKNLESAIAAFHGLKTSSAFADWRYVIAGDGDETYQRALASAAASGAGRGHIDFVGWLDDGGKREWLRRAAVLVQPSHQESFGVSVLEALATGTPVVVSTGVSLARDIRSGGAGWVAEPTPAALEETLRHALGSAEERDRRGHAARALASRFTWPSAAAALETLYAEVCGDRRAAGRVVVGTERTRPVRKATGT